MKNNLIINKGWLDSKMIQLLQTPPSPLLLNKKNSSGKYIK